MRQRHNCSKVTKGKIKHVTGFPPREGRLAVRKILMGQVWKKDNTGDTYLVTKLYSEVFSTYAVLRKIGGEELLRVKAEQAVEGTMLRGFTYTQDSEEF